MEGTVGYASAAENALSADYGFPVTDLDCLDRAAFSAQPASPALILVDENFLHRFLLLDRCPVFIERCRGNGHCAEL